MTQGSLNWEPGDAFDAGLVNLPPDVVARDDDGVTLIWQDLTTLTQDRANGNYALRVTRQGQVFGSDRLWHEGEEFRYVSLLPHGLHEFREGRVEWVVEPTFTVHSGARKFPVYTPDPVDFEVDSDYAKEM